MHKMHNEESLKQVDETNNSGKNKREKRKLVRTLTVQRIYTETGNWRRGKGEEEEDDFKLLEGPTAFGQIMMMMISNVGSISCPSKGTRKKMKGSKATEKSSF